MAWTDNKQPKLFRRELQLPAKNVTKDYDDNDDDDDDDDYYYYY